MDRTDLILALLSDGSIEADPESGFIHSRRVKGQEGKLVQLPGSNIKGYRVHMLVKGGTRYQVKAHQIIWISINGRIPQGLQIDHINRNRSDNRIFNLRVCSPKENIANATSRNGENNANAKLSDEEVLQLRRLKADGAHWKDLCETYGITKSHLYALVRGDVRGNRSHRLKALGNAVVPQQAYPFFAAIAQVEAEMSR
jgi:hypothetical protein